VNSAVGSEQLLPVGVVFAVLGLLIAFVPARWLIQIDRKTGYWIYRRAPDEATGLRRAAVFYKIFGMLFILVGLAAAFLALRGP